MRLQANDNVQPLQPDRRLPAPIWICPICEKLMRIGTIEVANGEEHTTLACATCGTEVTQSEMLLNEGTLAPIRAV